MKEPKKRARLCVRCIRFYRERLSGLKPRPVCRFYPSCSEYALTAFETHGVLIGFALSFFRILRCNPLCKGGVDYVPGTEERRRYRELKHTRRTAVLCRKYVPEKRSCTHK